MNEARKPPTGIDDTLSLEAVYLSAPIPRNLAVLTVLGAVFDKVYFPGVYLPSDGYDIAELDKEIARLESLPGPRRYSTQELIGILTFTKHVGLLRGFCEFTRPRDLELAKAEEPPQKLVRRLYDAIYPPRPGFTPLFETAWHKGIPGSDQSIVYPGTFHYLAGALLHSARSGVPLLNDVPGLNIPGIGDVVPVNDSKLLMAKLAIECTRIALPQLPLLRIEDLIQFRDENKALLRAFRRSMLAYAAELNGRIRELTPEEFEEVTRFFIQTEIVPTMDALNEAMNAPARPLYLRAIDGIRFVAGLGGAYLTGGEAAALMKALSSGTSQLFVELQAAGDKREAQV
jgi:hypothetical protein